MPNRTAVGLPGQKMIGTQDIQAAAGEHLVHFYEHEAELSRAVGGYLAGAIHGGGVAIVIATESHRRSFAAELEDAGIDAAAALASNALVSLDAAETLARFMPDGRIDAEAFRRVIGSAIRQGATAGRPVRAYGEMVALLWDAGDVLAAIELEELWNELGRELSFALFCAYHSSSVANDAEALERVCQLHSSVLRAPGDYVQHTEHRDRSTSELSRHFPAEIDAPRAARRFIAEVLRQSDRNGTLVEDAELVVSELATNAVVHARSPFSVIARLERSRVRLSVHDRGQAKPILRSEQDMAESGGRGLHLVAALATNWGVESTTQGKAVWAELRG